MRLALAVFFLVNFSLLATDENTSKYLKLNAPKALVVKQGKTEVAVISGVVAPGMHIQANPASMPNLIPTELKIDSRKGLEVGKVVYPPGKTYRLKGSDRDLLTLDGPFEIKVPVTAALAKVGKVELKGALRFQACNDTTCFFPEKLDFSLPVQVKK